MRAKTNRFILILVFMILFSSTAFAKSASDYRKELEGLDSDYLLRFRVDEFENGRYECINSIVKKYGYESEEAFINDEESIKAKRIGDWIVDQKVKRDKKNEEANEERKREYEEEAIKRAEGELEIVIQDIVDDCKTFTPDYYKKYQVIKYSDLTDVQKTSFDKWYKNNVLSNGYPGEIVSYMHYPNSITSDFSFDKDLAKIIWNGISSTIKNEYKNTCVMKWYIDQIGKFTTSDDALINQNRIEQIEIENRKKEIAQRNKPYYKFYIDYYKLFGLNKSDINVDYTNIYDDRHFDTGEGVFTNVNGTINEIQIEFAGDHYRFNMADTMIHYNIVYGLKSNIFSIIKLLFKIDPNCNLGTLFVANDMYGTKTIYLKTDKYVAYMAGFLCSTPEEDIKLFKKDLLRPLNIYCYDYIQEDSSKADYFNAVFGSNACQYMCTFTRDNINLLSGAIGIDNSSYDGLNINPQY